MGKEKTTRQNYDDYAKAYHQKRQDITSNFWNACIEIPAITSIQKGVVKNKTVLDMGCGSGISTRNLQKLGAKVVGIDFSKKLIDIARRENSSITFIEGDIQRTPFKKNQFEVVSSSLVFHYLKELLPVFKEVSRILKRRGLFIFSMHHPTGNAIKKIMENGEIKFFLEPYFSTMSKKWEMVPGMDLLTYQHVFEDIVDALFSAGFVVEKIIETRPPAWAKKVNPIHYERTTKYPSFCVFRARKL